jgi:hypothetical protein
MRLQIALAITLAACAGSANKPTTDVTRPATATITNASRVTKCAEEDNVYVKISGEALTGMRIEARQPSYIGQLTVDDSSADFSDCHFSNEENPVYHFEPKKVVLWESEQWYMLGLTYATFWRPNEVPVVVAGKTTEKLHLLQLHKKDPSEPESGKHECLVLYPPDGYWRAKPIPAQALPSSVYGTSFVVGAVTDAARPYVDIQRVEFVPAELRFKLDYADGTHGSMRILEVSREKLALEYQQDKARGDAQPLAAIRSMFVTHEKSDVAEVSLRTSPAATPTVTQISEFAQSQASDVAFGRSMISKHNPSAPDMWFGEFTLMPR